MGQTLHFNAWHGQPQTWGFDQGTPYSISTQPTAMWPVHLIAMPQGSTSMVTLFYFSLHAACSMESCTGPSMHQPYPLTQHSIIASCNTDFRPKHKSHVVIHMYSRPLRPGSSKHTRIIHWPISFTAPPCIPGPWIWPDPPARILGCICYGAKSPAPRAPLLIKGSVWYPCRVTAPGGASTKIKTID